MLTEDDVKKVVAQIQSAMKPEGAVPDAGATAAAGAATGKPKVRLPGEGRLVADFAREVGAVMATNGVYLRDAQPVVIDPVTRRMVELDADLMRTYAEKNLVCVKMKKVDDEVVPVPMTMGRETAKAVLSSHEFTTQQRVVRAVTEVPLPVLRADGGLELLGTGYDVESKVLVLGEKL